MTGRLSTCAVCGGVIERRPTAAYGWGHTAETPANADGHRPEPDDSATARPDSDDTDPSREAWDRLVQSRALALATTTEDYTRQGLDPATAAKAAQEDADLLTASATEFADAVDRSGTGLPYDEAVLIEGGRGPVVCAEKEWTTNRLWWETMAAGGTGKIDRLERGRLLLHYLRTGDNLDG